VDRDERCFTLHENLKEVIVDFIVKSYNQINTKDLLNLLNQLGMLALFESFKFTRLKIYNIHA
jgi:hypothetical protein